jgi:hypothetical protein
MAYRKIGKNQNSIVATGLLAVGYAGDKLLSKNRRVAVWQSRGDFTVLSTRKRMPERGWP